jgi:hypothetical protein
MALPPETTPAPTAVLTARPATSPAVNLAAKPGDAASHAAAVDGGDDVGEGFKIPKLLLEIRDLSLAGASDFLRAVNAFDALATAAHDVLRQLYVRPEFHGTKPPPTRSINLVIRDMPGVAYTTGIDLDPVHHKEVHFSAGYIADIPADRLADEIRGVLTHELVHCLQYNGFGTCPGGLIEGIADWVRLRCQLSPPHWRREPDGDWDRGYEHTAYFLEYLEDRFGAGTVRSLNEKLRVERYREKPFWTELLGRPVSQLWGDYCEKLKDDEAILVSKDDVDGADDAGNVDGDDGKAD